jgi:hypothetical protein
MKSLPILLAIDFDLTIANSQPFPKIQGLKKGAKKYINKLVNEGYHITIWTCRTDCEKGNHLSEALSFLNGEGVMYHSANKNYEPLNKCFGNDCRKISADFYVDDKGLWLFGLPSWFWIYWIIKFKSFFLREDRKILSHCKPEHFQ